ncbi:hypothetical protein C3942_14200 [Solimonas fluminis]|uniref:DUF4124 domain-containing protein n=1 Tax=Solimonas fluminis TaxID=2086571 RepID=A0A2S5TEI6_9GAMM|nr:DUF4124 domain-containing protein [Solimonas fluminis]PPE73414.1 hypothetical protein C3942_14200 [Solimonas fluminis]
MRELALLIVLALPLPLAAQVYKYTDEKGVIHYTDKAPGKGAKPVTLPPLHTYKPLAPPESEGAAASGAGGNDASAPPADKGRAAGGGDFTVSIVSPVPDQTNRDASGNLAVSVKVSPEMPEGYTLAYYVDGSPSGEPTASASTTLSGIDRGQHSISVGLQDPDGNEVARSAPVTVYLRQPTIKRVTPAPPRPAPR